MAAQRGRYRGRGDGRRSLGGAILGRGENFAAKATPQGVLLAGMGGRIGAQHKVVGRIGGQVVDGIVTATFIGSDPLHGVWATRGCSRADFIVAAVADINNRGPTQLDTVGGKRGRGQAKRDDGLGCSPVGIFVGYKIFERGTGGGQPIITQIEFGQRRQVGEGGRNLILERVVAHGKVAQRGEVAQLAGQLTAQLVVLQPEAPHHGEITKGGGDGAAQLIIIGVEQRQSGHVTQFRGQAPGQLVAVDAQNGEGRQIAQLWGDRATQVVIAKAQRIQLEQMAEGFRNGAAERVAIEC